MYVLKTSVLLVSDGYFIISYLCHVKSFDVMSGSKLSDLECSCLDLPLWRT